MSKQIITGHWAIEGNTIAEDSNCTLIKEKLANDLVKISASTDGWDVLYKEKDSNFYWELTYTQSQMQGGGPAQLESFTFEEVKDKYNLKIGD